MLRLEHVSFAVDDESSEAKEILNDINLTIDDNKFVAITGPNGGGKSTLAKIVAGIEKPTGGKIFIDDLDVTDMGITERARIGVGFAFQQPVRFKGIQVIDLMRIAAGGQLTILQACDALSEVGLCARDYIYREVNSSLSGGELKRIEIATVMTRQPKLSIFDEPEAGIDLWSFQNLIRIFEKMRAEIHDSSIVIISHQERILEIADEIVLLKDGQIEMHDQASKIMPFITGTESAVMSCTKLQ